MAGEAGVATLALPDLEATRRLGAGMAAECRAGDAVLLAGPLGVGKTELARAMLRAACGDSGLVVPSPSYTLVQSYQGALPLHHFDLWRLEGPEALAELGWDEAREGVVIVEWPERLGRRRPEAALLAELALSGDGRRVRLSGGTRWAAAIARWCGQAGAISRSSVSASDSA